MFQNFFKRALPLDVFCDVLKKKNILLTMPLTVLIAHLYWKVHYKICSWIPFKNPPEKNKLGDKNILEALPNVCAEEPVYGSAFCHKHKEVVASMGYPSDLKGFIESCGANPSPFTKSDKDKVKQVLEELSQNYDGEASKTESGGDAQGTSYLLRNRELAKDTNFEMTQEFDDHCQKNIGKLQTLNKWSRGVLVVVGAGGIIEWWCPLYDSGTFISYLILKLAHLTDFRGSCAICSGNDTLPRPQNGRQGG